MNTNQLFLGIFLSCPLHEHLRGVNPVKYRAFVHKENSEFLSIVRHQNQDYLGKYVKSEVSLPELELISIHTMSLCQQLNINIDSTQLVLFSVELVENSTA